MELSQRSRMAAHHAATYPSFMIMELEGKYWDYRDNGSGGGCNVGGYLGGGLWV